MLCYAMLCYAMLCLPRRRVRASRHLGRRLAQLVGRAPGARRGPLARGRLAPPRRRRAPLLLLRLPLGAQLRLAGVVVLLMEVVKVVVVVEEEEEEEEGCW
jgi:hypothetical protein